MMNNSNMSDHEFVANIGAKFEKILASRKDEDYKINPEQWEKFLNVLEFFVDLAEKNGGTAEEPVLQPKFEHGGVTAYFTVLDIHENDIPALCEALLQTNAITIDATTDGRVCISVSVPHIFVRK